MGRARRPSSDVVSGVRIPKRGRVLLDGRDITKESPVDRARLGLRRTFQRVQTFGWLSVEENVLAALEWQRGRGGLLGDLVAFPTHLRAEKKRRAEVREVLEQCGLGAVRDHPAGSLPIGQGRMVEVARALVVEPTVLLLDEPSSGLDHDDAARLAECVQGVKDGGKCALMVVEHDMNFIMEHSDRIVVLNLGEVLATGTPIEIQENAEVRAAYLGDVL